MLDSKELLQDDDETELQSPISSEQEELVLSDELSFFGESIFQVPFKAEDALKEHPVFSGNVCCVSFDEEEVVVITHPF